MKLHPSSQIFRVAAISVLALSTLTLTACGITKPADVPEYLDSSFDNAPPREFITQGDLAKVRLGMSPLEVRNRLGPPMLGDKEEKERWDYVLRKGAGATEEYIPYAVYFKDSKVSRIAALERPPMSDMAGKGMAAAASKPVEAAAAPAAAMDMTAAAAAPAGDEVSAINDMLTGWANAWTAKDAKAYLGYYADTFEHGKGSRKTWEGERRKRLSAPSTISLSLTDVNITLQSESLAEVTFNQSYTSNKFTDKGSKTLVLSKAGGAWKIQKELFKK